MWISRQTVKSSELPLIQTGKVTMSNKNGIEAVSSSPQRNIDIYSPYGYSYALPSGGNMMIAKCDGRSAATGVLMNSSELKTGEIKITSASGGYIFLRNDGSVVINGLVINKNGEMETSEK